MSEKFSTRMGDGERVWMDSTKIREDIKDGTVDAAKKAGIPELTAGEQDYMFEIITEPLDFDVVKDAIDSAQIKVELAEITMIPQNMTKLDGKEAEQMIKFMEALDDSDDIQKFYSNADIPDEVFDAM